MSNIISPQLHINLVLNKSKKFQSATLIIQDKENFWYKEGNEGGLFRSCILFFEFGQCKECKNYILGPIYNETKFSQITVILSKIISTKHVCENLSCNFSHEPKSILLKCSKNHWKKQIPNEINN